MPRLSRRRLLSQTARLFSCTAIMGGFSTRAAWSQPVVPNEQRAMLSLSTLVRDLFPHDALADSFYVKVAGIVQPSLTGKEKEYATFAAALDQDAGGSWRQLDPARRREILAEHQDDPFFAILRDTARATLYVQPEVWALIGYGSNALAQGGYLNRGFNDIDWLEGNK